MKMWAPTTVVGYLYGSRKHTRVEIDARLIAGSDPFELWSNRSSYDQQIKTVWRSPSGDVALPLGSMSDFNALDDFVRISVKNLATGKKLKSRTKDVCLNSQGQRVRPDAPARSPYPQYCFANPYSLGSVQGIQAGWSNPLLADDERGRGGVRLGRRTTSRSRSPRRTRTSSSIPAADASRTVRVAVKHDHDGHDHDHGQAKRHLPSDGGSARQRPGGPAPYRPRARRGRRAAAQPEVVAGLGHQRRPNGNFLRFAATVWNAGDSPLVVDGFRREGEPSDGRLPVLLRR